METRDTLKQTGAMLSFLLLIPPVYLVNNLRLDGGASLTHHMFYGGMFTLASTLLVLAYCMFAREHRDGAMEYLRSLPIAPSRIALVKILPRLLVAWILVWLFVEVFFGGIFMLMRTTRMGWDMLFYFFLPPALLMTGGFLYGVSGRRGPLPALVLLMPVPYLWIMGHEAAQSMFGLLLGNISAGMGVEGVRAVWASAFILGALLPSLLPLLVLMPLFRVWNRTPERVLTESILKRGAIPTVLLLALFLVNTW
jgi:hypothetical protein